jgi:hypothetical protein
MTGSAPAASDAVPSWAAKTAGWARGTRPGLFSIAAVVGVGAGLGAVAFRYLVYFFTWLAAGHVQFGQQGYVGSSHLLSAMVVELGSTWNAIYKTMFDARRKLRAALAANGYLDDQTSRHS